LKELHQRTIWGFLFVVVLTGAILLGAFTFGFLFLLLSLLALQEFYILCKTAGYSPQFVPGIITGTLVFVAAFLNAQKALDSNYFLLVGSLIFAFSVYELYRKKTNPLINIALTVFGILYVSIPFALLNFLAFRPIDGAPKYTFELLITLFLFVWSNDSGAYVFGVSLGKHRLFERISPKKSWEGFFGGILTTLLAAWLLSHLFTTYKFNFLAVMGLIVSVSSTLGDLVESMIKREIGVKDSGSFMPGHGGVLDRFDSILLASPIIYFAIQFFV
jgi:phosphatidate cytidylyltransferase